MRHGLCVCAVQRMNGQDKVPLKGYGSRCQAHSFECVKNCNAAVCQAQMFPVCITNGPPPKGHPANLAQLWEALESTWASIPVEPFDTL